MEGIHGVDVSWMHHSKKEHHHRDGAPSSPGLTRDTPPKTSSHGGLPSPPPEQRATNFPNEPIVEDRNAQVTGTSAASNGNAAPAGKTQNRRPGVLGRSNSDKGDKGATPEKPARRSSWISNISSKFTAQQSSAQAAGESPSGSVGNQQTSPSSMHNGTAKEALEKIDGHVPQAPTKTGTSFLSNALRRLSSGTITTGGPKAAAVGGLCPRRVLNVDPNRERCVMPELDNAKLRRVAFNVDVEIAGGPRYKDEGDEAHEKKTNFNDNKIKERGEGAALKHPEAVAAQKDANGVVKESGEKVGKGGESGSLGTSPPTEDKKDNTKKKEKKKRSEAERKDRKERKRRKAEENGQIPMEFTQDEHSSGMSTPTDPAAAVVPQRRSRPTTDPLRIYRRCCQLRETPILKRITEQLAASAKDGSHESGVVLCLDLTGSRLQLADVYTLSDWLAIVPVQRLLLEDADLGDEAVRVILAGLLAARKPQLPKQRVHSPPKEKSSTPACEKHEERSGFVEKISLKNNPKLTREGWKHISLFIYMCKSLRALDVSMIPFARVPRKRTNSTAVQRGVADNHADHADMAEIFSKAISERLGGSRFEELIMAECALHTEDIRKIVDAITYSGLKRLSLAGNNLSDEALEHVLRYLRSGVPDGLDLGGTDLRHRLGQLCSAFTNTCSLWALCLANCNLTPDDLKALFPALVTLTNFRFLDLSHNRELFSTDPSALTILRKYLPKLKTLKRMHLTDVAMSPAQAIGLAEVIPEVPQLAHLNMMENAPLMALSNATDEEGQEEACALYASLMCAARSSSSIICIDMEVPAQETSEIVKALAKQVVAYCLRNMDTWTISDAVNAGDKAPPEHIYGPEKQVDIPEVLMHLVGNPDGTDVETAPDNDYIVGGTGVVKALSYCLLEKASDLRRGSGVASGATTPRKELETTTSTVKSKNMSRDLLSSARKIRARLHPAIIRESRVGDDMAYKRLIFLDQTLQGMIKRFEDEYPDTRVGESSPESNSTPILFSTSPNNSTPFPITDPTTYESDSDEGRHSPPLLRSRHNSDVSLASRALGMEEGHIHRLGQKVRRDILKSSSPSQPLPGEASVNGSEPPHLTALRAKFMKLDGQELLQTVKTQGWDAVYQRIGENAEELKALQEENPEDFEKFKEAQLAALENAESKKDRDAAVED